MADDEPTGWDDEEPARSRVMYAEPQSTSLLTTFARTMASFWVMCLMLVAAGLAAASFIKMQDSEHQLALEQDKTRPEAWALVEYRQQLVDAVRDMRDDPYMDAPVTPPPRPPLQIELDQLRAENQRLREEITKRLNRVNPPQPRAGGWPS
ncbi:MAG TPA: hypothetical protein VG841_04335 [Caulobacterales bacterium]|nr:hypothetical protein [Caulobacterales bacterium]